MVDSQFSECLLEQYKMYSEYADRISERRITNNKFYISILSAIIVINTSLISTNLGNSVPIANPKLVLYSLSLLGIFLCGLWFISILSFRNLNKVKFAVIHQMESQLAFQCYSDEWDLATQGKSWDKYVELTKIERVFPLIMALFFIAFILIVAST